MIWTYPLLAVTFPGCCAGVSSFSGLASNPVHVKLAGAYFAWVSGALITSGTTAWIADDDEDDEDEEDDEEDDEDAWC